MYGCEKYCNLSGIGTQNAGLVAAGATNIAVSCTEEYNGTSWSTGGSIITTRYVTVGVGSQNESFIAAGYIANIGQNQTCTEEYNGTSWSVAASLITARRGLAGAGSQGAGLVVGGLTTVGVSCTEEYLKSSYTIVDCYL